MIEQAPQSEKAGNEIVPAYIFDKAWQEQNFTIPENDKIRAKLRTDLEGFSHYGIMWLPENVKTRAILLARVAAIDAHDAKMPRTKKEVLGNKMESRRERLMILARELSGVPFPGINPEAYARLKADVAGDEGRSLYEISSPTIDELIERLKNEGMKVVLSRSADGTYGRDIFILPAQSDAIQSDNLFPRHLQISGATGEKLQELILLQKQMATFAPRS